MAAQTQSKVYAATAAVVNRKSFKAHAALSGSTGLNSVQKAVSPPTVAVVKKRSV